MSAALLVKGVKLVAALSVAKVVGDIVKVNTINTNVVSKVASNIGGFVLGSMIMDKASEHVDNAIKSITKTIEEEKQKEDNDPESSTETEGP